MTDSTDKLEQAKAVIRDLMNELDSTQFGAIHTLAVDHPTRSAYTRAWKFLEGVSA